LTGLSVIFFDLFCANYGIASSGLGWGLDPVVCGWILHGFFGWDRLQVRPDVPILYFQAVARRWIGAGRTGWPGWWRADFGPKLWLSAL